jgi:hypothetical protein
VPPSSGRWQRIREAVSTSETSVSFYKTTRHNVPDVPSVPWSEWQLARQMAFDVWQEEELFSLSTHPRPNHGYRDNAAGVGSWQNSILVSKLTCNSWNFSHIYSFMVTSCCLIYLELSILCASEYYKSVCSVTEQCAVLQNSVQLLTFQDIQLTEWSSVFGKIIVSKLVKKFPTFDVIPRCLLCSLAHHWTLS